MIEFNVRIRVDTQDVDRAFRELLAALRFNGLAFEVTDEWRLNNRQLPKEVAQHTMDDYVVEYPLDRWQTHLRKVNNL